MIKTEKYVINRVGLTPKFEKPHIQEKLKTKKRGKASPIHPFSVKIHSMDDKNLELDFIGLDFSLANAYRRIILAEVATMAIEKVHMYNNTSIVQDEVLAHRIGLVPLSISPHFFNFRKPGSTESEDVTEETCLKFKLRVKCRGKKDTRPNAVQDPDDVSTDLVDKLVTTEDLQWVPIGNQASTFEGVTVAPLVEDLKLPADIKCNFHITLAKLNPGQKILLEAYAYKGIGSDHAKFQPGLCWYRMLPEVTLNRRVLNEHARQLQQCFSPGVIELIKNEEGDEEAIVMDARYDTSSRNVYKYDHLKDAVTMTKNTKHIIFHVESHSAMKSYEILDSAVTIMIEKCDTLLQLLET
uniref:DNA-directed RNA polymerases I and III subunit RPAC1-like n=2 Tax=Hirondellea gigas TaxID=1518452 RepID=A0A2P2I3H8_9CRUS